MWSQYIIISRAWGTEMFLLCIHLEKFFYRVLWAISGVQVKGTSVKKKKDKKNLPCPYLITTGEKKIYVSVLVFGYKVKVSALL